MSKPQSIKFRLNLSLSSSNVAFEKLFHELAAIENKYVTDSAIAAIEKRKHLTRILLAYSNSLIDQPPLLVSEQVSQFSRRSKTPEVLSAPESAPQNSPTTSLQQNHDHADEVPHDGVLKEDGSRQFGGLNLKIATQ